MIPRGRSLHIHLILSMLSLTLLSAVPSEADGVPDPSDPVSFVVSDGEESLPETDTQFEVPPDGRNPLFDLSTDALSDGDWDHSYEGIALDVETVSDNSAALHGYKKRRAKASEGAPLYVMIGDSYGTHRPYLAELLAQKLKLKKSGGDFYGYFCGGHGTARTNGNRNFMRLLNHLPSDRAVTDVLFIGGIHNDRNHSEKEIRSAVASLASRAKEKYPNARLLFAIGNWHSNDERTSYQYRAARYQKFIENRIPWYREACAENGIIFLEGVPDALRASNNLRYFKSDGHHPTALGTKKLANAIANAIGKLNRDTKIRRVALNKTTLRLKTGQSTSLKARVKKGRDAASDEILFLSEDTSVCRVNKATGDISAVSPGSCRIICRAADGSGKQAVCTVKVS